MTFEFETAGDDSDDDNALMDKVTDAIRQLRDRTLLLSFTTDAKKG